jgi:hypothetical protein
MPVDPWPVNDEPPGARLIGQDTAADCPRKRIHPSKSNTPKTAHEYGLSAAQQASNDRFHEARKARSWPVELSFRRAIMLVIFY